ncbi:primosome assembly protein PriA [Corynebacterium phocae]|uniref:Probable replication restart protein PriA n=1 Tax=Corynebacterium phocae TaxID=161895 RepID=A0A1L7D2X4_9CORY|nr:primosomal protein N' [Corynebacterium phocae]APT92468.1 primosome assembly protein PriA [Corynebacterium phocae]KAA8725073.1 primosomal protein N' [Corynebacterium phocae]
MPKNTPAPTKPVVRVLPLLRVAHLDRPFDYCVPERLHEQVRPGIRVRVRFNGTTQDALVIERREQSDFTGELLYITDVVSPFVVYPKLLRDLVESLADRYAGTRSDIVRLAIPPRNGKAEESDFDTPWEELGTASEPDLSAWATYAHGQSFVDAVLKETIARAAWQVTPGTSWARPLAALATKVALGGGGVVMVVPNQRDLDQLEAALRELVSAKQITVLANSLGAQARYRRYLSAVTGQARIVIGTRSAAFAPVDNLQLAVIFDDGDDSLVEPHKPYIHTREVITTRSAMEKASLIIAGYTRTAETQLLVESGWLHDLVGEEKSILANRPDIVAVGQYGVDLARDENGTVRLQGPAYKAVRSALDRDQSVVVQVPRKGYVPVLSCSSCKKPARCRACNGPLGFPPSSGGPSSNVASVPTCAWCGRVEARHRCAECGSPKLRALVMGSERTAEQMGQAFPSTRVIISGGNKVIDTVPNQPALVICTPGAEPRVEGGLYGAALLLDTGVMLGRQDLRASEETLAAWANAARLVAPASAGGTVIVAAEPNLEIVQYLQAWNMTGAASAELSQRREVRFPPAVPTAAVDGPASSLRAFVDTVELPAEAEVLGPVPLPVGTSLPGEYDEAKFGPAQRLIIRTPPGPRAALGKALRKALALRAGRKEDLPLRVQVDPIHFG